MNGFAIDFLKYRWLSAAMSLVILTSFIGVFSYRYVKQNGSVFNYSVEFTGGIQTLLKFSKPVVSQDIISALESSGWHGVVTREFAPTEHMVRVKKDTNDVKNEAEKIRSTLADNFKDNSITISQTDSISGGVGERLRARSFYAVILALIVMLLYIALRFFSFAYSMGTVISLFHDAVVIFLAFLIFNKEISVNVIGAILTVLGYSINDTIVVFARIRDNFKIHVNKTPEEVINLSLNETLRRTILTTFATAMVVLVLLVLGGEALHDLALALFIGIVFGIYSTIFIASPVVLWLYRDTKKGLASR